jgi:multiple sugar transport system substrate-binding protein
MQAARSMLGAFVLCTGFAAIGVAGPHVDWLDDGVVLLKLGPEYDDAVIETSRAELGELLGADQKPYAGLVVRLLTHDEGARGPISGPIQALRPVWEELTGGRLELDLVPISELHPTLMLDLQRGTHRYDAVVVAAYFYGDLIAGDHVLPVEPLMASGRFPRWSYDVMPPALRTLHSWGGTGYGVLNDADGQVLYYRRDVLADPANQAAFKAALGYDLRAPPTSWQQVLDIARFFDGKNWDQRDDRPDRGMVLHLKPGEQGFYHFQSLSAPFAIAPGPTAASRRNVYWFDPADMKPLINSPGHVAALELLQQLNQLGPADQMGWRLPEAWDYFLRGKAVFVFSWGDVGALCQDEARSLIKGNCGAAMLPGSTRYWDFDQGTWVESAEPNRVGNTTGGSWHGVLLSGSANQEAAYSFLALMALPPVSLWNAQHGWTGINPGYTYQFPPPAGTARLADYIRAGWDRADVEDYLQAYHATFNAPTMLPYLRIRGTPEYWSVLDSELASALGGRKTAQEALDAVAAAWDGITDRLGREQQLEAYREAIGYSPDPS